MNVWELPTSLLIGGVGFSIRTDYRDILYILSIIQNDEYETDEKAMIALICFYPDYDKIPQECLQEALEKEFEFIDCGESDKKSAPRLMDWDQDAKMIIPAVNRVLGREIRADKELHWWTFLSAYMEIGECAFSSVLNIRSKKARGKKLEKYEQEYYKQNKDLIDLKAKNANRMTESELDDLRRILKGG